MWMFIISTSCGQFDSYFIVPVLNTDKEAHLESLNKRNEKIFSRKN